MIDFVTEIDQDMPAFADDLSDEALDRTGSESGRFSGQAITFSSGN